MKPRLGFVVVKLSFETEQTPFYLRCRHGGVSQTIDQTNHSKIPSPSVAFSADVRVLNIQTSGRHGRSLGNLLSSELQN